MRIKHIWLDLGGKGYKGNSGNSRSIVKLHKLRVIFYFAKVCVVILTKHVLTIDKITSIRANFTS